VEVRTTSIRDVLLLAVATVLGTALASSVAILGLPIAAAGIAGLAYRGRAVIAAVAAGIGVGIASFLVPGGVVYAAPVALGLVIAVVLLPKRSVQLVAGVLVGVFALASAGFDAVTARAAGTTLPTQIAEQARLITGELVKSLGASASADLTAQLKQASAFVASSWPSAYFQSAVLVAVVVIAAIAWAARRAEVPLDVPSLARLDITPHVLWVFVAGLLLLAASYGPFSASATLGVVGLNLVLCARTLFFLQGIGVAAGVLDRAGVGLGGRILGLAALAALDVFTLAISFSGLLDFWINFRHLPRDGEMPAAPVEPSRRW
jgi:hypothetical protein